MSFRRRFSTLKGRMSFSEEDLSPNTQTKARLKKKNKKNKAPKSSSASPNSGVQPQFFGDRSSNNSLPPVKSERNAKSMKVMDVDAETVPDKEEVDRLFEQMMDELAMTKPQMNMLKLQSTEKKWKMVVAHRQMMTSKTHTKEDEQRTAPYWIDKFSDRDSAGKPRFTVKDGLTAQSVFRTSHREFLLEFIDSRGVKIMNELTNYYTGLDDRTEEEFDILSTLIDSYRLLMNTEIGMEGVLVVPGSVTAIAMAMDYLNKHDDLTEKVILLLSVACWWSERGRKQVMEAIKVVKQRRRELSRFQTIVFLLEYTTDISFKASIATFITTVCNTPQTIEQRVKVRNDFFTLDIVNVFTRILQRSELDQNQSEEDVENWANVKTQYEVFVTMMRQDQHEIVHKLIHAADEDASHFDLSNLGESWKLLQRNANKADCQDNLLNVIQGLFMIPTVHELATPIYKSIVHFIFEATSIEKISVASEYDKKSKVTDPPKLDFEELGKVYQKKLAYDAKIQVFHEKHELVTKQQKIIHVMQKRLLDVSEGKVKPKEALDLQRAFVDAGILSKSGVGTGGTHSGSGGGSGGGGTGNAGMAIQGVLGGFGFGNSNEIEIMKDREQKLKQEITELQKQVAAYKSGKTVPAGPAGAAASNDPIANYKGKLDETKLVPAGIAPGTVKKDPAPVPKAGMPGSLEQAPIKVERGAKPATAKRPISPAALALKGGKGPGGGAAGGLAAMLAKGQAARAKPKVNPRLAKEREALKKLGLPEKAPVKPKIKMTSLFWNVISPESLENTVWPELSDQNVKYNPAELESLFGKKKVVKKKAAPKKDDGNETVQLIDGKRRQNVAIAKKRLKLDSKTVYNALLAIDVSVLTYPIVQVLEPIIPTTDELTLLDKFVKEGRDPKKLADEEQFLFEISRIPRLANRLKCIKTNFTISQEANRIYRIIKLAKAAVDEVNSSAYFRQMLEVVLAVGNFLNGGTVRGAAWGFKLDILPKLYDVKDSVNTGTLMHYLYIIFERSYPQLLNFTVPKCDDAANISFKETTKDLNMLAKSVQLIRTEIKKKSSIKGDNFKKIFTPFEVRASEDIAKLQKTLDSVRGEFQSLCVKFAEESDKAEPNTFFPKITTFERDLTRARENIDKMRKEKERKKMVKEKMIERQTQKKLRKLVEATQAGGEDVEGLIQAFKQSQSGKTSQVVDRFLQKYRKDRERQQRIAQKRSKNRGAPKYLDA